MPDQTEPEASRQQSEPEASRPQSPLLAWPGAVEASWPDEGVAAHYGDPLREQRSDRGVGRGRGPVLS